MSNKKVLYIGNKDTPFIFNDVAIKTETDLETFYGVTALKEDIIEKAISEKWEMVIINIDEVIAEQDSINDIIEAISKSVNTKLVIMAQGYKPDSSVIVKSAKVGVKYFILETDATSAKDVYVNTLAGIKNVYDVVDMNLITKNKILDTAESNMSAIKEFKSKTISVGGCMSRIGTTTVAIQLTKYFMAKNKTVCYVDYSDTNFIELCKEFYGGSDDKEHHRYVLGDIDIYYDVTPEILQDVYQHNYDYIVFDVGDISVHSSKQTNFLEKDFRILCAGCKPQEYKALYSLLSNIYNTTIYYMYFAVPSDNKEFIENDWKESNKKGYFFPFLDDCFSLEQSAAGIFDDVFPELKQKSNTSQGVAEERKKSKKERFFRKDKRTNENKGR